MKSVELVNGYECSGNSGRFFQGLSSCGRFTGVPLSQVLKRVGVGSKAREVVFFGTDRGKEDVVFSCANQDQQYRITVAGGEVSDVTWATEGDGHAVGDPVSDEYAQVTIQDVIDKGNDPDAAQVDVEWPAGQDHPSSIYVDQDKMVADEEVTWVISDVEPA